MIKIEFEKTDEMYTFRDAIVLPDNHTFTDEQLEELKEQRFQAWLSMITAPPIEEELPIEDMVLEDITEEIDG
jgi:hypothetical protein